MMKIVLLFVFLLRLQVSMIHAMALRPALSQHSRAHRTARETGFVRIGVAIDERKGLGAFATTAIRMGNYIGTYDGEVMTQDQVKARYWGKTELATADKTWLQSRHDRGQEATGSYLFERQDGRFVDAEDADCSSWCRFMNHATEGSEECNVKAFDRLTDDGQYLEFPQFYAIQDIAVGDELHWDYGPLFFRKRNSCDDDEVKNLSAKQST